MNAPYGLEITDSCLACRFRKHGFFCSLPPDLLKPLNAASHQTTLPSGALLYLEGQTPRGVFMLCAGRVKLSTTSREGRILILRIAEAGEILGLSAVVSGRPHEVTAETTASCLVNFIKRETMLKLMEESGELGLRSAQALSREYQSAYRDIHDLILARSSAGKLARLLLTWTGEAELEDGSPEVRVRAALTHEEMAQMIGASRETVTRLLSDLKKKQLICLQGSTLVIRDRTALEKLAA